MEPITLTSTPDSTGQQAATWNRTCRIQSADLLEGMYVAELDRPWIDSPFLIEGFLIDCQAELDALRQQCAYVYVDRDLSDPSLARHLTQLELRGVASAASAQRPQQELAVSRGPIAAPRRTPRHLNPFSPATRQHFRSVLAGQTSPQRLGWLTRPWAALTHWWRPANLHAETRPTAAALAALLPPGLALTPYPTSRTLSAEWPHAQAALHGTVRSMRRLHTALAQQQAWPLLEVDTSAQDLVESLLANPDALLWAAHVAPATPSDPLPSVRTALYMLALGRHLGLPQATLVSMTLIGLLADLGKSQLPRPLLDKPGMLSPAELQVVQQHVQHSLDLLRKTTHPLPDEVLRGIAEHHERFDGSGYPHGLRGAEISFYGQVAAIADVFSALITPRPYAHEVSPQEALMSLYEWSGRALNPAWVEQFVHAMGVFPVGHLVELNTGEVAAVTQRNPQRPAEPSLLILTSEDKRTLPVPLALDWAGPAPRGGHTGRRILRGLPVSAYGIKLPEHPQPPSTTAEHAGPTAGSTRPN